ncbi:serine/threonine protein kinase [Streptomyces sp. NBC_01242]|uniref:serine/threonine protein kinase n=1 Tax=unclassified Streptomyces TaxID=2593676 RepID=UPI00224F33E5|nr:serine/threonine protein kinase [Streptomyces sp. NBC_01242]MCX4795513.1 serine/threonine protein kinase [Streptomyces sp. NBC_01242]
MEHLRQDDPARIGPYVPLARLDERDGGHPVPDRRYIARSADGERTVLVCVPRAAADPSRWAEEVRHARRSSVPRFLPVSDAAEAAGGQVPDGADPTPWYAAPYAPALVLPAALAAHGGPLPERFVRAWGAALAQSLAAAHAQGVTHAGVSPSAVLLMADGPWLAGFGAVRAAGSDGLRRPDLAGLEPAALAPEQLSGGLPRPLGDVYGLGAVLSYASTGQVVPENGELPAALRPVITACLARDPAARPAAARVAAELTRGTGAAPASAAPQVLPASQAPSAPQATVLDGVFPVPLPPRVLAELARHSAAVLAAELPGPPIPAVPAGPVARNGRG